MRSNGRLRTFLHTTASATRWPATARPWKARTALFFPTAALRPSPTRSMATPATSLTLSTRVSPSTPSTLPPPTRPPLTLLNIKLSYSNTAVRVNNLFCKAGSINLFSERNLNFFLKIVFSESCFNNFTQTETEWIHSFWDKFIFPKVIRIWFPWFSLWFPIMLSLGRRQHMWPAVQALNLKKHCCFSFHTDPIQQALNRSVWANSDSCQSSSHFPLLRGTEQRWFREQLYLIERFWETPDFRRIGRSSARNSTEKRAKLERPGVPRKSGHQSACWLRSAKQCLSTVTWILLIKLYIGWSPDLVPLKIAAPCWQYVKYLSSFLHKHVCLLCRDGM